MTSDWLHWASQETPKMSFKDSDPTSVSFPEGICWATPNTSPGNIPLTLEKSKAQQVTSYTNVLSEFPDSFAYHQDSQHLAPMSFSNWLSQLLVVGLLSPYSVYPLSVPFRPGIHLSGLTWNVFHQSSRHSLISKHQLKTHLWCPPWQPSEAVCSSNSTVHHCVPFIQAVQVYCMGKYVCILHWSVTPPYARSWDFLDCAIKVK